MAELTTHKTGKKRSRPVSQRHRRTIAPELFAQWRDLARKKDADAIAELLRVSKPTIDKALIYGCCHSQVIIDGITKFFADRLMKERDDAERLESLKPTN